MDPMEKIRLMMTYPMNPLANRPIQLIFFAIAALLAGLMIFPVSGLASEPRDALFLSPNASGTFSPLR
jgi:hypothetical protein